MTINKREERAARSAERRWKNARAESVTEAQLSAARNALAKMCGVPRYDLEDKSLAELIGMAELERDAEHERAVRAESELAALWNRIALLPADVRAKLGERP